MIRRLRLAFAPLLVVLSACSPSGNPGAATPTSAAPATPEAVTSPAPAATAAAPTRAADARKPSVPSLKVATFDGGQFDLAEHRGRWVVVNFWATWCTPCLKEIPDLDAFDQARKDVDVIGLAYEEIERQDMEAFLKQHPIHYPIAVLDVYNPPADFDEPKGLPMTYLIAPDGKVAKKFLGPTTAEDLGKLIAAAGGAANGP